MSETNDDVAVAQPEILTLHWEGPPRVAAAPWWRRVSPVPAYVAVLILLVPLVVNLLEDARTRTGAPADPGAEKQDDDGVVTAHIDRNGGCSTRAVAGENRDRRLIPRVVHAYGRGRGESRAGHGTQAGPARGRGGSG